MIETVILDLDGPLLDGRPRHYSCYRQILLEHGFTPISLDDYWQMKRAGLSVKDQLSASGAESIVSDYQRSWLELIEQPEMLGLDILQPGTMEKLRNWLDQRVRIVLITMRRHIARLNRQLTKLGLDIFLDHVVTCPPSRVGDGKAQRLKSTVTKISPEHSLWVGDTEVDIEAARLFGCRVWAVTCGLRTEAYLASLSPDFLSPNLTYVDLMACHES
jgi:phosphoglycolate phosphatase